MADEKKIIIDEDWKSQVQSEKEQAQKKPPEQAAPDRSAGPDDFPMPPASLEILVGTLVTEALVALGQVPHPATGETVVRPHQAKYLIDMIDVLAKKTKGNLTPDEEQLFDNLLHQLRMVFVGVGTSSAAAAP